MSLATRCPSCGTIFRVVQDQLKVSEGWVRCGQCHEVFHGIEALFDLDNDPALATRRASRAVPPAPPPARVFAGSRPLPESFAPASDAPPVASDEPTQVSSPLPAWRDVLRPQLPAIEPGSSYPPIDQETPPPTAQPLSLPAGFTSADGATPMNPVAPPATRSPEMPRGTIAPRFAARLAEESARFRESSARDATSGPEPDPRRVEPAPTEDAPPDPADFAHVVPTPEVVTSFDLPPTSDDAPLREPLSASTPAVPVAPADDGDREDAAAAPPARQPRTILLRTPSSDSVQDIDAVVSEPSPAPSTLRADPGATTLPSLLFDEDDDEDERAGPPTLASMLPEDAGEWPPRPRVRKARDTATGTSTALVVLPRNDDPRFLREAQRSARWSRPGVRAAMAVALVLLAAGAAAQLAWPQRDTLAARYPATAPAWRWLCEQAGCRIEAPRAIASLALDGSSLTRTDVDHVLLFSADLHNRADHAVRMPSFDLTFMDLNGAVVARKVLAPSQIGIRQDTLPPEAELHVHARIQVGGLDASGFQAEMFYP